MSSELRATSEAMARIHRIGALYLADPSKREAVFLEIVDAAIAITGSDFGNIQLIEPGSSELQIIAQRGFPDWYLEFWSRVSPGHGTCGTALQARRRVVVEDVERSPIFNQVAAELAAQLEVGVRAVVSTPIIGRSGRVLGIFSTHYRTPRVPEAQTLQFLDVLARQAADIIEVARAEEANALARRELERVNRAKDEFLATMSHELRTPLNAILGWATILRRDHSDAATLERGLETIQRNAMTQARLVSDLLDVSRVITGKLRLSMKKMALSAVIHAAADVVRPAADSKGVHLVVDVDPEVGAVIGDPDRLQQVVWNLLSNAVRFTPTGGRVTVTARRAGSSISLSVQDTGVGIPAEHLPHVFERFRQVDSSSTRAHGGLGLGLAIVRHLVEAHGGSVSATSEGHGLGATFRVDLPIRAVHLAGVEEADAPAEGPTHAAPAAPDGHKDLRNVRALVVDDDADSLELERLVLEGAGATVTTAPNAAAALDAPGPFDIIISDIGMPGMDGYEFMRRIRSRDAGATVPAIALTAYARTEDGDCAIRSGYQEHLTKPVDSAKLVQVVKCWARSDDAP